MDMRSGLAHVFFLCNAGREKGGKGGKRADMSSSVRCRSDRVCVHGARLLRWSVDGIWQCPRQRIHAPRSVTGRAREWWVPSIVCICCRWKPCHLVPCLSTFGAFLAPRLTGTAQHGMWDGW